MSRRLWLTSSRSTAQLSSTRRCISATAALAKTSMTDSSWLWKLQFSILSASQSNANKYVRLYVGYCTSLTLRMIVNKLRVRILYSPLLMKSMTLCKYLPWTVCREGRSFLVPRGSYGRSHSLSLKN